jgi:hypothetical protein
MLFSPIESRVRRSLSRPVIARRSSAPEAIHTGQSFPYVVGDEFDFRLERTW